MASPFCALTNLAMVAVALGVLSGCVDAPRYPMLEPLSFRPSPGAARDPVLVDSLAPTFRWKTTGEGELYEFGMWNVEADGSVGTQIIHQRKIPTNSYTVEIPLPPNRVYYWSVKPNGSSVWSTISLRGVNPASQGEGLGSFFKIKTPSR